VELSVIHGLQQGNEVLKEIHKEMNIETVERLLEESQEARDYQRVRPVNETFVLYNTLFTGGRRNAFK
jgi:Snf7